MRVPHLPIDSVRVVVDHPRFERTERWVTLHAQETTVLELTLPSR